MGALLLSGACGSGKSTLLTLGYRAYDRCLGATATFDTDTLLMMVDPRWELTHDERRLELMYEQAGLLAESFLARPDIDWVVIGGNALHTPQEINPLVGRLLALGEVFHATLDPSIHEIKRRVAERGADKTPEWLDVHVEWMRQKYGPWTCRVDNSTLTPTQTLREIVRRTAAGEGRLTGPLSEDPVDRSRTHP